METNEKLEREVDRLDKRSHGRWMLLKDSKRDRSFGRRMNQTYRDYLNERTVAYATNG